MIIIHVTLKRFSSPCSCSTVGDGILVESDGALSVKIKSCLNSFIENAIHLKHVVFCIIIDICVIHAMLDKKKFDIREIFLNYL